MATAKQKVSGQSELEKAGWKFKEDKSIPGWEGRKSTGDRNPWILQYDSLESVVKRAGEIEAEGKPAAKKSASGVDLPAKQLRPNLQKLKEGYEKQGCVFTQGEDELWSAEVPQPGENSKDEPPIKFEGYAFLSTLFKEIDKLNPVVSEESLVDFKDWKTLPLIISTAIAEFAEKHEVMWLYRTENGAVEIDYINKQDKVGTSAYVDLKGSIVKKRQAEFGANIPETILSMENFFETFSFLKPTGNDKAPEAIEEPVNPGEVVSIELTHIQPSPLVPQQHRRERFDEDELKQLAASIKKHGVINPITVRPLGNGLFEIVAGERRWRASGMVGLLGIRAVVKNLSDADAAEIQLIENLQRTDPHPLDEALSYKYLMDNLGYSLADVALKVGKNEKYILSRLKLNDLIPAAQKQLTMTKDGLPLTHALEIAKFPLDIQDTVLNYAYRNGAKAAGYCTFRELREKIERGIMQRLQQAPFSIKSTELRTDGLACVECPERTGFSPTLFGDEGNEKNDSCLNKKCWAAKTQAHILLQRTKIATEAGKPVNHIPLVTREWWIDKSDEPDGKYLKRDDFKEIKGKDTCDKQKKAVLFNGSSVGQTIVICAKTSGCETHWKNGGSSSSSSSSEVTTEERRIRKEELVDIRVGEKVRRAVLRKAAETFDAEHTIFNHPFAAEYKIDLLYRLWKLQCSHNELTARVIREVLQLEESEMEVNRWGDNAMRRQIANLSEITRSRLLFLLLVGFTDEMLDEYNFKSQKQIKKLAKDFKVDYQLLDAEERLAQAPMKHKDMFRSYLQSIESGDRSAKLPRMYSEDWKPKE